MLKKIIRYFVYGNKRDGMSYIKYLNSIGAKVSNTVYFPAPNTVTIDETRPYLIEIGNYVTITEGCSILTHGFDWSVLKIKYGEVIGSAGKVKICDNVFIGMNTTILKGVTIGSNTIIGSGSVVTKDIPENVVAAGNPCRVICSIEDYYNRRKIDTIKEAKSLIRNYYKKYGKFPSNSIMAEFMWLFSSEEDFNETSISNKIRYGGNYEESLKLFHCSDRKYSSLQALCEEAINENEDF